MRNIKRIFFISSLVGVFFFGFLFLSASAEENTNDEFDISQCNIPCGWPTEGGISQGFDADSASRGPGNHNAVDIFNSKGTPIWATASGRILEAGYTSGYGNYITIDHNGYYTRYAHLNELVAGTGNDVTKNQLIGYMGDTGYTFGDHLHYEIHKGCLDTLTCTVDPIFYMDYNNEKYDDEKDTHPTQVCRAQSEECKAAEKTYTIKEYKESETEKAHEFQKLLDSITGKLERKENLSIIDELIQELFGQVQKEIASDDKWLKDLLNGQKEPVQEDKPAWLDELTKELFPPQPIQQTCKELAGEGWVQMVGGICDAKILGYNDCNLFAGNVCCCKDKKDIVSPTFDNNLYCLLRASDSITVGYEYSQGTSVTLFMDNEQVGIYGSGDGAGMETISNLESDTSYTFILRNGRQLTSSLLDTVECKTKKDVKEEELDDEEKEAQNDELKKELAQMRKDIDRLTELLTELVRRVAGTSTTVPTTPTTPVTPTTPTPTTGIPAVCQTVTFNRNLTVGDRGTDVRCLQSILNLSPRFQVSVSGPGSPGNETDYFGPATRAGVIKFQEAVAAQVLHPHGLTAGTGFVGPSTRNVLNALLGK